MLTRPQRVTPILDRNRHDASSSRSPTQLSAEHKERKGVGGSTGRCVADDVGEVDPGDTRIFFVPPLPTVFRRGIGIFVHAFPLSGSGRLDLYNSQELGLQLS